MCPEHSPRGDQQTPMMLGAGGLSRALELLFFHVGSCSHPTFPHNPWLPGGWDISRLERHLKDGWCVLHWPPELQLPTQITWPLLHAFLSPPHTPTPPTALPGSLRSAAGRTQPETVVAHLVLTATLEKRYYYCFHFTGKKTELKHREVK